MSYRNFVPEVWADTYQTELERKLVFVEDTNRNYEGEISDAGDTVRILGVGKPTITDFTGRKVVLGAPEEVADTSVSLVINQIRTFNFGVDDIDKRQAKNGLVETLMKESSAAMANEVDKYIANLADTKEAVKLDNAATTLTAENILDYVDRALVKLYENDVPPDGGITLTAPPWFVMMMKKNYTAIDTDNSAMLKNGVVGMYGNVKIKMSNNVAVNNGTSLIQLKTKNAIAFAQQITKVEPYRPQQMFEDAVKGLNLFGAKIVRPKEMVILNCKA